MQPKLLLCLALVLSGGLFGCANPKTSPEQRAQLEARQKELCALLAKATPNVYRTDFSSPNEWKLHFSPYLTKSENAKLSDLLRDPETAKIVTREQALAAIKQQVMDRSFSDDDLMFIVNKRWPHDPSVVAFFHEAMMTRGEEAVYELWSPQPGVWDDSLLEPTVSLVEKMAVAAASPTNSMLEGQVPWMIADIALDVLARHHDCWIKSKTIPPRLSKAVLTIFPSLTNASMPGPQPGDGLMWCNAIRMLGKTCDPAMVALLRPYLDEKSLAGDPGGGGLGNPITMRFCDEAAGAIDSLLDDRSGSVYYSTDKTIEPMFANGVVSTNWQYMDYKRGEYRIWPGYDPAWKGWDKSIAKLKKHLDALGLTNMTVVYSNLSFPFAVTNTWRAIDPVTGLPMPRDKVIVIDPDTGLPVPTKSDKHP